MGDGVAVNEELVAEAFVADWPASWLTQYVDEASFSVGALAILWSHQSLTPDHIDSAMVKMTALK